LCKKKQTKKGQKKKNENFFYLNVAAFACVLSIHFLSSFLFGKLIKKKSEDIKKKEKKKFFVVL